MATMQPPGELEPQAESDWTPLAAFMASEGLVADDIVRLIDWRALAELYGFKPLRGMHSAEKLEQMT